jgi:hypothetical protein
MRHVWTYSDYLSVVLHTQSSRRRSPCWSRACAQPTRLHTCVCVRACVGYLCVGGWVGGWVVGWAGGWLGGRAGGWVGGCAAVSGALRLLVWENREKDGQRGRKLSNIQEQAAILTLNLHTSQAPTHPIPTIAYAERINSFNLFFSNLGTFQFSLPADPFLSLCISFHCFSIYRSFCLPPSALPRRVSASSSTSSWMSEATWMSSVI